jgi:hypothetical protein
MKSSSLHRMRRATPGIVAIACTVILGIGMSTQAESLDRLVGETCYQMLEDVQREIDIILEPVLQIGSSVAATVGWMVNTLPEVDGLLLSLPTLANDVGMTCSLTKELRKELDEFYAKADLRVVTEMLMYAQQIQAALNCARMYLSPEIGELNRIDRRLRRTLDALEEASSTTCASWDIACQMRKAAEVGYNTVSLITLRAQRKAQLWAVMRADAEAAIFRAAHEKALSSLATLENIEFHLRNLRIYFQDNASYYCPDETSEEDPENY